MSSGASAYLATLNVRLYPCTSSSKALFHFWQSNSPTLSKYRFQNLNWDFVTIISIWSVNISHSLPPRSIILLTPFSLANALRSNVKASPFNAGKHLNWKHDGMYLLPVRLLLQFNSSAHLDAHSGVTSPAPSKGSIGISFSVGGNTWYSFCSPLPVTFTTSTISGTIFSKSSITTIFGVDTDLLFVVTKA